ncbi:MAG: hypothetical protein KDC71_22280 [Acidobacteria bacterium]|nr:hypothetical protein [Acidobacteriota bacterium]
MVNKIAESEAQLGLFRLVHFRVDQGEDLDSAIQSVAATLPPHQRWKLQDYRDWLVEGKEHLPSQGVFPLLGTLAILGVRPAKSHFSEFSQILDQVAHLQLKIFRNWKSFKGLFNYLWILMAISLGILSLLVNKSIPAIVDFYTNSRTELPALTQSALWLGSQMWVLQLLLLFALIFSPMLKRQLFNRTSRLQAWWPSLMDLPWLGALIQTYHWLAFVSIGRLLIGDTNNPTKPNFNKLKAWFDLDQMWSKKPFKIDQLNNLVRAEQLGCLEQEILAQYERVETVTAAQTASSFESLKAMFIVFYGLFIGFFIIIFYLAIFKIATTVG